MSAGWIFLAAMVGMYGVANLLQSIAAANTTAHETLDPKLLMRLARHRTYVAGLLCQILGFVLAFLARRDLPLFLVQSAVAAGLGVTAILGVLMLKWRLPKVEMVLLVALCAGLAGLVISAQPHKSHQVGLVGTIALLVALVLLGVAGFFTARLPGVPGSVALGALAGIAFGAAAVASRPLANIGSLSAFITDPLLYLLVAHSIVGQLLLGLAMQRGSTTAAVAAMDAAAAVPAAIVGLLFLGDKITPGLEWLAGFGFLVTLSSVIGLTFFAEPQHHHDTGRHRQLDPSAAGLHAAGRARIGKPRLAPRTASLKTASGKTAAAKGAVPKPASATAAPTRTFSGKGAATKSAAPKSAAAKGAARGGGPSANGSKHGDVTALPAPATSPTKASGKPSGAGTSGTAARSVTGRGKPRGTPRRAPAR